MTDEKYLFVQDIRDKKNVARSARSKRTHNGKGGSVKLPSDYMTKKEIQSMNSEAKSYRLNDPMSWTEFMAMPDDIKGVYIKMLREKFNAPDSRIAKMMGVSGCSFSIEMKRLGLSAGHRSCNNKWDADGFYAWCGGASAPIEEAECVATAESVEEESVSICEDTPVPVPEKKVKAIPRTGTMVFDGKSDEVLASIQDLLMGAYCHISISWELRDNG